MSVLSIEELSSTSYKWLKSLGIKINKKYLIDERTTHQDYPAISGLANFLDMGNMDYVVTEADRTYIKKNKYQFEEFAGAADLLYHHYEWTKQANLSFTQTLFINGRQMPVQYSLNDIESLLPQLIGFFEPVG